ncbi:hypothetical protein INT44_003391 [Umbelopsis vinacea]|uniref:Uncharacterized protein n=1 Tax=Umbelopsis vinacea TaxID=44442 RepID=A0A8H7PTP9_9FUNG|nr:hypothetical protein INT44_003391 [Umbelopsis vinacea]
MIRTTSFIIFAFAIFALACAAPSKTVPMTGTFEIHFHSYLDGEAVLVENDVANKHGSYLYFHIKTGLNTTATYKDYKIEFRNGHDCKHVLGEVINVDTPKFKINGNGGTDAWCIDKKLDITKVSVVQVLYQGAPIACSPLQALPNFEIPKPSHVDACHRG